MDETLDNSAMVFFLALAFPGLCKLGKQELNLVRSYSSFFKLHSLLILRNHDKTDFGHGKILQL